MDESVFAIQAGAIENMKSFIYRALRSRAAKGIGLTETSDIVVLERRVFTKVSVTISCRHDAHNTVDPTRLDRFELCSRARRRPGRFGKESRETVGGRSPHRLCNANRGRAEEGLQPSRYPNWRFRGRWGHLRHLHAILQGKEDDHHLPCSAGRTPSSDRE